MSENDRKFRKLYEGCNKLWCMLADGKDSNEIIEEAYKLIRNPIVISTNMVLFKSIGIHRNELLDNLFLVGYDETAGGPCEPIHIMPRKLALQDPQTNYGLVIAGIYDKEAYLGRVLIACANPFDEDITKAYASTLAKIMSNIFSAEVFRQVNTYIPDYPLFHSLITGEHLDTTRLASKLDEMSIIPKSGMNVVVIDQRNQPLLSALSNMKKYSDLLLCKIYSMYHGNIVMINSRSSSNKLAVSELFIEEIKKDGFRCGVSREFFLLSDTQNMYQQALFALKIGDFFDETNPILEFEKYSAEYIICLTAKITNLVSLLDPRLIRLKEYDDSGPGYLIETLRVHFKNIKSPTEGARSLFIHRNTYFHRLSKIEELTGWDINDGNCIAKVNFSLKVVDLLEQAEVKNLSNLYYLVREE